MEQEPRDSLRIFTTKVKVGPSFFQDQRDCPVQNLSSTEVKWLLKVTKSTEISKDFNPGVF